MVGKDRTCSIGVDVGGTFTDLVLIDDTGMPNVLKVSSTPDRPEIAVIQGVRAIAAQTGVSLSDVTAIMHGTTVGSNTMLQRVGADTGLITTLGFRDILEIGRLRTPNMFDLTWDKPEPLVPRRWRREVQERTDANGAILSPVDAAEVAAVGRELVAQGVTSIAICFINAHKNHANELATYGQQFQWRAVVRCHGARQAGFLCVVRTFSRGRRGISAG
jgi:N-methylhydantoinase A